MASPTPVPETVTPGSSEELPPELVEQLAGQLAEKDSLVVALTEQLERAAEQLDRLQRSGADRRKNGFLPPEIAADHKQLVGDLARAVQQWEDMQAGVTLGRIEVQLTELRDFIAARLNGSFVATQVDQHATQPTTEEPGLAPNAPPDGAVSDWERIKSQFLEPAEAGAAAFVGGPASAEEPLPEPPAAVDLTSATLETLATAVESRDEYIVQLLHRLRTREVATPALDWTQLDLQNPEWSSRLQALTQQLESKLRMAEVELSIERARLARENGRVLHQQEIIDKQLKQLGLSSVEEAKDAAPAGGTQQERRWVRFLSKGGRRDG